MVCGLYTLFLFLFLYCFN
uniref:Uncharacterized protein n=1 Tax=Rhizophora mucronata TaxID=61149 RepID=A0A2P2Q177_RHIMU